MQESISTPGISAGPSAIMELSEMAHRCIDATCLLLYYFPYSTGSWSAWYRRLWLAVSKAAGSSCLFFCQKHCGLCCPVGCDDSALWWP
jgi:hypothetical protein